MTWLGLLINNMVYIICASIITHINALSGIYVFMHYPLPELAYFTISSYITCSYPIVQMDKTMSIFSPMNKQNEVIPNGP